MTRRLAALYVLFAVSGFCGLIYESIWAKYLRLFLGHAAYAQTVVLVVFIGGMALGAWLCGRFSQRIGQPLLFYAGAEFLVGICAVVFHRTYGVATAWAYDQLLPAACDATGFCYASWALAALLILPQSILLGSTFPLMTAGILRLYADHPGRKIALLYFLNSIGAVGGVLASTFVLVPRVGLPGASLTAGIANVALALAVYFIARREAAPRAMVLQPEDARVETLRIPRLLLWAAALTGLSSFIYEVVWIRLLSLVLGASTHAFEIMLATFILGLALGGLWVRGRIDRLDRPLAFLAIVQIVMGLLAAATIPLANQSFDVMAWLIRALAKDDAGYVLFNVGSGVIAAAIMSPPTFFAGMTLPLITYSLYVGRYGESSIGKVYAANTLGSIVGVILAIHLGLPLLGVKGSLVTAAGIDVAIGIGLFVLVSARQRLAPALAWSCAGIAGLAIASVWFSLDPLKTASGVFRLGTAKLGPADKLLFHRDGKTATVDVVEASDGVVGIRTNGKTDAAIQMRRSGDPRRNDEATMTLVAALPLAHKPEARRVAVVGFGSGMTTAVVLADPKIRRVDTIEIEPAMVEGAANFLPIVARAFDDQRSKIIFDDAKSFLARNHEVYDIIISEPSNPWVSGVASLFTEEFYQRVRGYIAPGGIFAQWLQVYEFDATLLGSITAALGKVFPDFDVYASNAGDLILIARKGAPLGVPASEIFEYPELKAALTRVGVESLADVQNRRIAGAKLLNHLLLSGSGTPNSDYFPYVDLNAPRARFKQVSAATLMQLAMAPIPVVEMLEGRPLGDLGSPAIGNSNSPQGRRSVAAERLLRAFGDDAARVPPLAVDGVSGPALAMFRASLIDCVSEPSVAAGWDGILSIAELVNPGLSPGAAESFWAKYEGSVCLSRLPIKYRHWIELFKAVGQREPAGTFMNAELLLEEGDNSAAQIEYLVLAAATGYLAAGRVADAKRLLGEAWPALPATVQNKPWFQLELQLVGG